MEAKEKFDKNYYRVHSWITYHYGKANKCENKECKAKSIKRYEWALKKGFKYTKDINSFIQLCSSCHTLYDFTDETRKKISASKKGKPAKNKRPVLLNDELAFESITEASIKTGVSITSINNNLVGLSAKTKKGVWTYQ